MAAQQRAFGEGILSRVSALVYTLLMVELMVALACVPGIIGLLFLDIGIRNIPLVALCALPVGPALSAAVYALARRSSDLTDIHPVRDFWRGYRLNWRGVLPVWALGTAWLAVLGLGLGYRSAVGLPGFWSGLLGVVALVAVVWTINALLISSLFAFRVIDVVRLSWFMIASKPIAALGALGVAVIAGAITVASSEALLLVFSSLLVFALLRVCKPMIDEVRAEFTR